MILLPIELIYIISSFLKKKDRNNMIFTNKSNYKIILNYMIRKKEIKLNLLLDTNFIKKDIDLIKDNILLIKSYNFYKIIKFIDNIVSKDKLNILNLNSINLWLKLYRNELLKNAYLFEIINNKKLYQWIDNDLSNLINLINNCKINLKNQEEDKIKNLLNLVENKI